MSNSMNLENITVSYDKKNVLSGLSYSFSADENVAITGRSGIGKTTLFNIITGLNKPNSGKITYNFAPVNISAVFQEDRLCEQLSAVNNIKMVLKDHTNLTQISNNLKSLGLEGFENVPVSQLSGGMKRRAAILRAIMATSNIIIMDEPFKGLDDTTKALTMEYVKKSINDKLFILITHDISEAHYFDCKILNLD